MKCISEPRGCYLQHNLSTFFSHPNSAQDLTWCTHWTSLWEYSEVLHIPNLLATCQKEEGLMDPPRKPTKRGTAHAFNTNLTQDPITLITSIWASLPHPQYCAKGKSAEWTRPFGPRMQKLKFQPLRTKSKPWRTNWGKNIDSLSPCPSIPLVV